MSDHWSLSTFDDQHIIHKWWPWWRPHHRQGSHKRQYVDTKNSWCFGKIGSPEFRLFVFAPNGQQQCAGEYIMLPDRANRQPVWEQKNGNFWIYSGAKLMTVFFFVLFWVKLLQGKHQYPELTVKIGILKPNCTFNPRFSFCYLCCRLSTLQYRMITEAQIRQHVMFKSARTMWRSARSKWSLDHWREGCKGQGYQRWTWMLRREKSMVKNHSCRGHTFRYLRKIDMIQKIPTWYC